MKAYLILVCYLFISANLYALESDNRLKSIQNLKDSNGISCYGLESIKIPEFFIQTIDKNLSCLQEEAQDVEVILYGENHRDPLDKQILEMIMYSSGYSYNQKNHSSTFMIFKEGAPFSQEKNISPGPWGWKNGLLSSQGVRPYVDLAIATTLLIPQYTNKVEKQKFIPSTIVHFLNNRFSKELNDALSSITDEIKDRTVFHLVQKLADKNLQEDAQKLESFIINDKNPVNLKDFLSISQKFQNKISKRILDQDGYNEFTIDDLDKFSMIQMRDLEFAINISTAFCKAQEIKAQIWVQIGRMHSRGVSCILNTISKRKIIVREVSGKKHRVLIKKKITHRIDKVTKELTDLMDNYILKNNIHSSPFKKLTIKKVFNAPEFKIKLSGIQQFHKKIIANKITNYFYNSEDYIITNSDDINYSNEVLSFILKDPLKL